MTFTYIDSYIETLERFDSKGKPCGNSYIPKSYKCNQLGAAGRSLKNNTDPTGSNGKKKRSGGVSPGLIAGGLLVGGVGLAALGATGVGLASMSGIGGKKSPPPKNTPPTGKPPKIVPPNNPPSAKENNRNTPFAPPSNQEREPVITKHANPLINEFEKRVRHNRYESAFGVNRDGDPLEETKGNFDSVMLPKGNLTDCTLTHNHPTQNLIFDGKSIELAHAVSFSFTDIKAAITNNMAEL